MSKMIWYAFYDGPGRYSLCSEQQFQKQSLKMTSTEIHQFKMNHAEFKSLQAAKNYLFSHLKGDIGDCRVAINEIELIRAKDRK